MRDLKCRERFLVCFYNYCFFLLLFVFTSWKIIRLKALGKIFFSKISSIRGMAQQEVGGSFPLI